jgi:hypothetical protein
VNAKVKRLHSPDIADLGTFQPSNADNFCFLLQVIVGPSGGEGEESFDVTVSTPKWLTENLSEDDILLASHYIIVRKYDFARIEGFVKSYCDHCSGDTWEIVAQKVGRLGRWEFEDYKE